MLLAFFDILQLLLTVLTWIIIIQAILSWLVAFNVINTYNDFVRSLLNALDRITEPLYRPIRRILPDFGGIDFSPLVRSEEHTSELQSLMRISYAVFCLKKKTLHYC